MDNDVVLLCFHIQHDIIGYDQFETPCVVRKTHKVLFRRLFFIGAYDCHQQGCNDIGVGQNGKTDAEAVSQGREIAYMPVYQRHVKRGEARKDHHLRKRP